MKIHITPFTSDMISQAAQILAARHAQNRRKFSLLPKRFENPQVAAKAIDSVWQKKFHYGYAAFRGAEMAGYLLGEHVVQPWARCGYTYLPGYGIAAGEDENLIQDLYARLGDDWVRHGVFSHGMYISAFDEGIIASLFDIGFGKERVDGMFDLRGYSIPAETDLPGVSIRRASKGDEPALGELSPLIMNALEQAHYWHPTTPDDYLELREGWSELAEDPDWTVWLAFMDGQAVGACGFYEEKESDAGMLIPSKTISFSIAVTKPEARGRGISRALVQRGLLHAQKDGNEFCYTDWISPNLLASRHWPRFGFTDVAYRLSKRIDPMISWTRQAR